MSGNDSYTKLLLHCDGADASTTFTDASAAAHSITANGNAQVDTAQSKFGGASLLLDGTGDYLSAANSADWNLGGAGSGDFTLDWWVRFNSVAAGQTFLSAENAGFTNGYEVYWSFGASELRVYNGVGALDRGRAWSPSTGTWYHVAVVRSVGSLLLFVDGASLGAAITDGNFDNASNGLRIGINGGGGTPMNGWMDEVRISKGIARWTSNFTPPAAPYSNNTLTFRRPPRFFNRSF